MSISDNNQGRERGDILVFPDTQTLSSQASEWVVKLDDGTPSPDVLSAFKAWVRQSDEHRLAFEEAVSFWEEMNVLTQVVLPREQEGHKPPASRSWFQRTPVVAASAFGFLAVVLSAVLLWPLNAGPEIYETKIGQQKTIALADGSSVVLNTNSRLEVAFSEARRTLRLVRGEAHFDVFHNKARPFEVQAGKGIVRAVGTAFNVHVRRVDVEVIVTEGTVELDRSEPIATHVTFSEPAKALGAQASLGGQAPGAQATDTQAIAFEPGLQVSAGNMMQYDRAALSQVKLAVVNEIEKQLSWQQGMLAFNNERLEKVVAEVGRYTQLKIIIPERSARELRVGGLFKIGDTESLFEALRDGFDIHVEVVSEDVVYLISGKNR